MSGNYDDFSRDHVKALIRRQGAITRAMAKVIAEKTGRTERNIIAASAAVGNYAAGSETIEDARARFIAADNRPRVASSWPRKVILAAVGLLMIWTSSSLCNRSK